LYDKFDRHGACIPLFTKHYLQSGKVNDFLDFSLAFLKISDKVHQTEKGKLELIELKSRMNYKRLDQVTAYYMPLFMCF